MDKETTAVQDMIYRHQNPQDCGSARYFIMQLNNYGLGSGMPCFLEAALGSDDLVSPGMMSVAWRWTTCRYPHVRVGPRVCHGPGPGPGLRA